MPYNRYGLQWPDIVDPLTCELACFRRGGTSDIPGGVSKAQHARNITKIIWHKKSTKPYVWNPWADEMLEHACQENWLWLSGCASSGKTDFLAIWCLICWMSDPPNVLCLVTSTSLKESRMRVWGSIVAYFTAGQLSLKEQKLPGIPGKLLDSIGILRTWDGQNKYSDKCGIHLITGEKSKEKENIGKLIGLKNKKVILACDEMPELSPALTEAASTNLITNEYFQMIGSGNFKSIYDPFGRAATPKAGWGSVSLDSESWECDKGICLRFDGMKSPNVMAGENVYPGIYKTSHLEEHRSGLGEHSAGFWRMCRSFPCPESDADKIFSEADFIKGDVERTPIWLDRKPIKIAALDPAFATGGDRAQAMFAEIGISDTNLITLRITEKLEVKEDIRLTDQNRSVQVARGFKKMCEDRGIPPENAAYDMTGGGLVFAGLLSEVWSSRLLGVQFGGAASDRKVKEKKASDLYANRVTELWYAILEFMQSKQLCGVSPSTAVELRERKVEGIKSGDNLRMKVEPKDEMKGRIGMSPDEADALAIIVELARERFKFLCVGMEGKKLVRRSSIRAKIERSHAIYGQTAYAEET